MQTQLSLTEGPIPRSLLTLALPILLGNVLQSVNGSVNAIWVGKYFGEAAFAAVGNSNVVMFLLFGVMFGFSMAFTVMVAQCIGARNTVEAKRVVGTSAVFFLGLSLALLDRWHADAIWWSFPPASLTSLLMASAYFRFGGWRSSRPGVTEAGSAPVVSA